MKLRLNLLSTVVFTVSVVAFSSCEKALNDATETTTSAEDFSNDMSQINVMIDMIQDIGLNQSFMQKNGNSIIPESVFKYTDTVFTDNDGIEIDLDFTEAGTVCYDGRLRKGLLRFTANKPFSEVGSVLNIWTIGDDGFHMSGYGKFMDLQIEPGSQQEFSLSKVSETRYEFKGNFWYQVQENFYDWDQTFNGTLVLEQKEGALTSDKSDDTWELTGSSNFVNRNVKPYEVKITETLERKGDENCSKTFTKGKIELQNDGSSTKIIVDFGDGTCDNDIEFTLPGGIKKKYTVE